jgi:putative ABC transport system permease protein
MGPIQLLRISLRKLWNRPLFTITTVGCLVLGIGAATAVFTVVNGLLLRPTPVTDVDDVAFFMALRGGVEPYGVSPIEIQAYLDRSRSFESLGLALTMEPLALDPLDGDIAERIAVAQISRSYLQTLGVSPVIGREFTEEEDMAGGPPAILLSYGLWVRKFGGDTSIIGRTIRLDGESRTVVGVLPQTFDLPRRTEAWVPRRFDLARLVGPERGTHSNIMVGRLVAGVSLDEAEAELVQIAQDLARESPETNEGWSVTIIPLRSFLLGDFQGRIRAMVYALFAAVLFMFLAACANVAHLYLVRFFEQERELALLSAIGAGRGQLLASLIVEGFLVAALGGGGGLLLARVLIPVLTSLSPLREEAYTGLFGSIPIDGRVFVFATAASVGTVLAFALVPVLRVMRGRFQRTPHSDAWRRGSSSSGAFSASLVAVEVAVSMILLVGAALLTQSFEKLSHLDLGFRPEGVVSFDFTLPEDRFQEHRDRVAFVDRIVERARAVPGVVSAAVTSDIPLRQGTWDSRYAVEGSAPDASEPMTAHRLVSPGYLETLGLSLLHGRPLDERDREGSERVVVVSKSLAEHAWPGEDPLGKRIKVGAATDDAPWMTVVGLVADVKEDRYNFRIDRPVWYLPFDQQEDSPSYLSLVVRTSGATKRVARDVRRAVAEIYPDLPAGETVDFTSHTTGVLATERFGSVLAAVLALISACLAVLGLYGVMAYSVRQRFREIGIRSAIGASPGDLTKMIVRDGMRVTLIGLIGGVIASLFFGRFIASLLFELSPRDPLTLIIVVALLSSVALVASYLPARWAARSNPVSTLRVD